MQPQTDPVIPHRLVRQLVNIHVEIPVRANRSTIWPQNSRVTHEPVRLEICRVIVGNGVLGGHELLDEAVGVAFEAICLTAALAEPDYVVGCGLFGELVGVASAEVEGGNSVDGLCREGSSRCNCHRGCFWMPSRPSYWWPRGMPGHLEIEGVALVSWGVFVDAEDRGVLGKGTPGLASAEIEHNEACATIAGGADDIADAAAGGAEYVGAKVEAYCGETERIMLDKGRCHK